MAGSDLDMWNRRYTLRKMQFQPGDKIMYGEFDLDPGVGAGALRVYGRRRRATEIKLTKDRGNVVLE